MIDPEQVAKAKILISLINQTDKMSLLAQGMADEASLSSGLQSLAADAKVAILLTKQLATEWLQSSSILADLEAEGIDINDLFPGLL